MYQQSCGEKDEAYNATMEAICARLIAEGNYPGTPSRLARILRVTIEGVWLDMMTMASPYSVEEARKTAQTSAALLFPKHFAMPVA
jgi:TetR/AcrR family transcriptional repressor of bet genes